MSSPDVSSASILSKQSKNRNAVFLGILRKALAALFLIIIAKISLKLTKCQVIGLSQSKEGLKYVESDSVLRYCGCMRMQILRLSLFLLGLSAIGIGLSIIGLGPDQTVQFFAGGVGAFSGEQVSVTGFTSVNVDSEFRFYSVFWVAYGVFLIQTSRNLAKYGQRVPVLLGLFFLGGVSRLLSYIMVGEPHILFNILMAIEFILPVILYVLWRGNKYT